MIDMNKKHRFRHSDEFERILCTDANGPLPVKVLTKTGGVVELTAEGIWQGSATTNFYDLVEIQPWEEFKIDEKVMVKDKHFRTWHKRHFAGVLGGFPATFAIGMSSWTSNGDTTCWGECRLPTNDELDEITK